MKRVSPWLLCALMLALAGCSGNVALARRAAEGDPVAQYEYGRRLLTGQKGVRQDAARAAAWLHAAAEEGYAPAQAALGLCYERGLGTQASEQEALRWYTAAAEQGNGNACMALLQREMKRNRPAAALRWLRALAETDNPAAQLLLGKLYLSGRMGETQRGEGVRYIRYAAMAGSAEACVLMASCYENGLGVPRSEALAKGWLVNGREE